MNLVVLAVTWLRARKGSIEINQLIWLFLITVFLLLMLALIVKGNASFNPFTGSDSICQQTSGGIQGCS